MYDIISFEKQKIEIYFKIYLRVTLLLHSQDSKNHNFLEGEISLSAG